MVVWRFITNLNLTPWKLIKLSALLGSGMVSAVIANTWYQVWQNEPTIDIPIIATLTAIFLNILLNSCNILVAWSEKMEPTEKGNINDPKIQDTNLVTPTTGSNTDVK